MTSIARTYLIQNQDFDQTLADKIRLQKFRMGKEKIYIYQDLLKDK